MNTVITVDNELGNVTKISSWHPIDGVWVKIDQIFKENDIEYYTNGELVSKPDYTPDVNEAGDICYDQ